MNYCSDRGGEWSHFSGFKFEWKLFKSGNNLLHIFKTLSPSTFEQNEHAPMISLHFGKLLFLTKTVHLNLFFQLHCYIFSYRMNQNDSHRLSLPLKVYIIFLKAYSDVR